MLIVLLIDMKKAPDNDERIATVELAHLRPPIKMDMTHPIKYVLSTELGTCVIFFYFFNIENLYFLHFIFYQVNLTGGGL